MAKTKTSKLWLQSGGPQTITMTTLYILYGLQSATIVLCAAFANITPRCCQMLHLWIGIFVVLKAFAVVYYMQLKKGKLKDVAAIQQRDTCVSWHVNLQHWTMALYSILYMHYAALSDRKWCHCPFQIFPFLLPQHCSQNLYFFLPKGGTEWTFSELWPGETHCVKLNNPSQTKKRAPFEAAAGLLKRPLFVPWKNRLISGRADQLTPDTSVTRFPWHYTHLSGSLDAREQRPLRWSHSGCCHPWCHLMRGRETNISDILTVCRVTSNILVTCIVTSATWEYL